MAAATPNTTPNATAHTHTASPDPLTPRSSSAGTLVLQWLTYAFWGWFIASLVWLIGVLFTSALVGDPVNEIVPYAIAATVVLLPLAFVCDLFYRKHEPLRKAGAAMVIMLIHAVIFALVAIGALITAVFTGVNSLINLDSANSGITGTIIGTAISAAVLFGFAFLRTLNPFKRSKATAVYAWGMLGLTVVLIIVTFIGPVAQSLATRNDRALERAVTQVNYDIHSYIVQNNELPANLKALKITNPENEAVITENKIEYIPGEVKTTADIFEQNTSKTYYYQLCVSYDNKADASDYDSGYYQGQLRNGASTYPQTTPHDQGRVCYKLYYEYQ